jgi:hypothetical protein
MCCSTTWRRTAELALFVVLVALVAIGCRPRHAPLASCADRLSGVWREPDGKRWEIFDRKVVELYPLFDTPEQHKPLVGEPGPVASPVRYVLHHQDGRVEGEGSYRLVDGARRCEVKFPVRLAACQGANATLSSQPVTAVSDRCAAAYSDVWIDVPLVRE